MHGADLAFAALAANPIGGLLLAIPFAILKLHYRPWLAVALGVPLAYLQVIAVDVGFEALNRIAAFHAVLERQRSPRVERLLSSGGAFWTTFLASPFVGPWMVMALMCYAHVPQRRVALPIALSLLTTAVLVAIGCVLVPATFNR